MHVMNTLLDIKGLVVSVADLSVNLCGHTGYENVEKVFHAVGISCEINADCVNHSGHKEPTGTALARADKGNHHSKAVIRLDLGHRHRKCCLAHEKRADHHVSIIFVTETTNAWSG